MIDEKHIAKIAGELGLNAHQVKAAAALLDEGATIPFISRYRKEATGSLDEVAVAGIRDRLEALRELDKRRESILKSLEETGKLTDELKREGPCRRDTRGPGRHLSPLPAQAAHQGHDGQGKGPGAAGREDLHARGVQRDR